MAGGKNAETVACIVCLADERGLTKSERVREGEETDEYRCDKGHTFGIDWSAGEAEGPQWPPSRELTELVRKC